MSNNPKDERVIDLDGVGGRSAKESRFYEMSIRCMNCGHGGTLKMPKGCPIDAYPCPACHCQKLVPNFKSKNKS